jgi:ADP-ribose pyrophosphatase YjhB (NUDIX family)
MEAWAPHVTVATVIEREGRFLLVEERDKSSGQLVFNQPAGHLEPGESLSAAALRETLEETGWEIALRGLLGIALYRAPGNGKTYFRTTFLGEPLRRHDEAVLDADIHSVHWLDYEAIRANSGRMRSPLVLAAIEQYRRGICYPLDLIYSE